MRLFYACFDEIPSFKGASTHVLSVCRSLRQEHEVRLFSLGALSLPARTNFRHTPQIIAEPNYLRRGEVFRDRVADALRSQRPDIAHFRGPWEGLPIVRAGIPSVYEVNGLPSLELRQSFRATPSSLATLARWEHECVQGASAVVCPSARIARCVEQRYGPLRAPITVIPNGYDGPDYHAVPDSAPEHTNRGPLRAVYLGTLHPWQGVFVALRALTALRDRVTLDVIAPPQRSYVQRLERVVLRRGLQSMVRVLPPMHRGELARQLPGYQLGLAPLTKSLRNVEQGCCPIKILDYLAHGLPVLASDLFVVRELLEHDHNALLVPPNNANALSEALHALVGDPARLARLRDNARPSLHGRLDWDDHGQRVLAVYRRHLMGQEPLASGAE